MASNQDSDNREDTLQGSVDEREGKLTPLTLSASQSPPPDGGFAAWCVVLGAWCTSFCSFGWMNSKFEPWRLATILVLNYLLGPILLTLVTGIGIFQDYYERELLKGYFSSTVAWIPSLEVFFMSAAVS